MRLRGAPTEQMWALQGCRQFTFDVACAGVALREPQAVGDTTEDAWLSVHLGACAKGAGCVFPAAQGTTPRASHYALEAPIPSWRGSFILLHEHMAERTRVRLTRPTLACRIRQGCYLQPGGKATPLHHAARPEYLVPYSM